MAQEHSTAQQPQLQHQLVGVVGRDTFPAGHLVITADDLGFTRGDGVFDATRVATSAQGKSTVDHLDRHFDRFDRSIAGIGGTSIDRDAWRASISQALERWTLPGEAVLKIMWSHGQETQQPSSPTQVFTITQLSETLAQERDHGVDVVTLCRGTSSTMHRDAPWLLGGVKTLSYAGNVAAKREAKRRGAQDVLFTTTDGYCLEAPTSALIVLIEGIMLTTPVEGTGILASITQSTIFEAAEAEGFTTRTALLTPEQVITSEGAWFVSSVRGAVPIKSLDGHQLPRHDKLTAQLRRWAGFTG